MMIRILDEVSLGTRSIVSLLREIKHWESMSSRSKVQSEKIASTVEKYDLWRSNDSVGLARSIFLYVLWLPK